MAYDGIPPFISYCGTIQPGFDLEKGELNGEPYDPLNDPFCTVAAYREWSILEPGVFELQENLYVAEMGEPAATSTPESWMKQDGYYCRWKSRVTGEVFLDFPETDAQRVTQTIEMAEGPGNCPSLTGLQDIKLLIRSTNPNVVLEMCLNGSTLCNASEVLQGGFRFKGYQGIQEHGGAPDPQAPNVGGLMEAARGCSPIEVDEGPGYCVPDCRLFSASKRFRQCTFDDFKFLPANRDLLDPGWAIDNATLVSEIYPPR